MIKDSNVYKYFKNENEFYNIIKEFLEDGEDENPAELLKALYDYIKQSIYANNIILQAFNSLIEKEEKT